MLTDQEIFTRHPELMELREFKTDEEIVQAFKDGGVMWETESCDGAPTGVAKRPTKVIDVGTYDNEGSCLRAAPVYYYGRWNVDGTRVKRDGFIGDLQSVPAKAVFTSKERAEAYFAAARKAYKSDPEWQAKIKRERENENRKLGV